MSVQPVEDARNESEPPSRPTPLPLPLDVPARRRSRVPVVVAAAIALFVVLSVVGFTFIVYQALRDGLPFGPLSFMAGGPGVQGEWWSGGGEFAVANVGTAGKAPTVVVWNRRSGKVRTLRGFRVVAVEPHAARVWVTPESVMPKTDGPLSFDDAGDGFDQPRKQMLVLSLDRPDPPTKPSTLSWAPWPNGRGSAALLDVDPAKGSNPYRLRFVSAGKVVTARIPPRFGQTFLPLGWSRSGKYFALRPLQDPRADDFEHPAALIVSAADGSVAAQLDPMAAVSFNAKTVEWDATRDILIVVSQSETDDEDRTTLRYLDAATGREGDALAEGVLSRNAALSPAHEIELLGRSETGVVVAVDTEDGYAAWRVSADVATRLGDLNGVNIGVWDERGGYLYLDQPGDSMVLEVSNLDGSDTKRIWTEKTQ